MVDGDRLVRLAIALVCAVTLIVPIFIGDYMDAGVLPPSRVERTAEASSSVGSAIAGAAPRRERSERLPAVPAAARREAARLTLPQLAAQVLLVGFEGTGARAAVFGELRRHGWGGVVITPDNALTLQQIDALAGEARAASRLPDPLVVADPNGLPPESSLADASPARVRARMRAAARRLSRIGVDLVLDPAADVGTAGSPLAEQAFSDDTATVARLSRAAVDGLLAGGVLPAPAHFPGQGAATQDPLDGPATVGLSPDALATRDLGPFRGVLGRAPAVVVSSATFSAYDPVTPAALVPAVTRRLLRGTLRFNGAAISDDVASLAAATGRSQPEAAVQALRAGIDLVHVPSPVVRNRAYAAVLAAARSKRLPVARLREAAARVLALKRRAR